MHVVMSALYNRPDDALDSSPCSPDAMASLRQASIRADAARARRVLQKLDGTLVASKLPSRCDQSPDTVARPGDDAT